MKNGPSMNLVPLSSPHIPFKVSDTLESACVARLSRDRTESPVVLKGLLVCPVIFSNLFPASFCNLVIIFE